MGISLLVQSKNVEMLWGIGHIKICYSGEGVIILGIKAKYWLVLYEKVGAF